MRKRNNTIRISYYGIVGIVLLFVVIIGKLILVSYSDKVDGKNIKEIAASRTTATAKITASRGTIYSINGEALAEDVNAYTVIAYVDLAASRTTNPNKPRHVVDKEYTANVLSEYLNLSPEYILSRLNVRAYQVEFGTNGKDISEKLKKEIEALELPGIDFIKSKKRYYPYGNFAPYIIGYAKKYDDGRIVGELGVEGYYNNDLTGKDGKTTYQKDAYGYQIPETPVLTEEAESGKDMYLTLDSNIQMYLENAVSSIVENYTAESITVTVANAKTGAILGSASHPSFDPNKLNITNYNNPLVSYSYEPGSTMKIFTFMAAMEEGIYEPEKEILSGTSWVGKNKVTDWNDGRGWGMITYDKGFKYSSNVVAANLGLTLGRDKLVKYFNTFGFGKKTGIEMSNEYTGIVNPKYDIETANVAFGQGMTSTPIQTIQALTALANEGTVIKPYIVDKVIDPDTGNEIYKAKRTELGQAVSKETVDAVLKLMYDTVNEADPIATGRPYKTAATTLVGKTGTAQIAAPQGGYLRGSYNTVRSFAGLFPYEDPEYIIYISARKLQGPTSAIAKAVKSIVESIAKYKNLDQLVVEQDKTKLITLDNYINKDVESSKEVLENLGLEVITIGGGTRVIDQYPNKNTVAIKGSKVFLSTNSTDITLPSMTNWTSNEVGSYCNLVGIKYNISGYGRIISQSVQAGAKVDATTVIDFTSSKKDDTKESGDDSGTTE